jgi:hypothetical protein
LVGTIALYAGQSSSPVNFYQQDRLAIFGQFGVSVGEGVMFPAR